MARRGKTRGRLEPERVAQLRGSPPAPVGGFDPRPPPSTPRRYGRGVYVQLRAWDRDLKRMVHLKGKGIRLYDWTPDEVQTILVRAFYEAQQRVKESHG